MGGRVGLVRAIFECACKCRLDRSEDLKGQYLLVLKGDESQVSCVQCRGQREESEVEGGLALGKPEGKGRTASAAVRIGGSVAVIVLTFDAPE